MTKFLQHNEINIQLHSELYPNNTGT